MDGSGSQGPCGDWTSADISPPAQGHVEHIWTGSLCQCQLAAVRRSMLDDTWSMAAERQRLRCMNMSRTKSHLHHTISRYLIGGKRVRPGLTLTAAKRTRFETDRLFPLWMWRVPQAWHWPTGVKTAMCRDTRGCTISEYTWSLDRRHNRHGDAQKGNSGRQCSVDKRAVQPRLRAPVYTVFTVGARGEAKLLAAGLATRVLLVGASK